MLGIFVDILGAFRPAPRRDFGADSFLLLLRKVRLHGDFTYGEIAGWGWTFAASDHTPSTYPSGRVFGSTAGYQMPTIPQHPRRPV